VGTLSVPASGSGYVVSAAKVARRGAISVGLHVQELCRNDATPPQIPVRILGEVLNFAADTGKNAAVSVIKSLSPVDRVK
jgi:hypothetical protein